MNPQVNKPSLHSLRVSRQGDAWENQADRNSLSARTGNLGNAKTSVTHELPNGSSSWSASPAMRSTLASSGSPLPEAARASLESRFGHDFSQVRIHDDAIAGQSAREAYASAYTVGNHVVFAPGAYHPSSSEGRQLLAHELTHVVQHRHHPDVSVLSRSPGPGGPAPRPLVEVVTDNQPTVIDRSKTLDEITHLFYDVPADLIGPGELYPSGHMIITCDDYKYGLTQSSFSISYSLSDADRRHTERSTSLLGSPTQFAECWYSHVRVHIRQRQTIYLPNDLATATSIGGSPCLDASETPAQANARTLIHERIHEADNPQRPPNHRFNTGYPFRSNGIQLIPCTGIQ